MTRLFDAPRQLVFDAMTKPEHVRRWWGCISEDHSVTVCEIDLRVGGAWRFVHRGPEGEYPAFYGVYKEIDAPGRLVYTEIFEPYPDGESLVTQLLTEENGKTRLDLTATLRIAGRARHGVEDGHGEGRGDQLRPSRRPGHRAAAVTASA